MIGDWPLPAGESRPVHAMTVAPGDTELPMTPRRRLLFVSPCTPDPLGTGWEQRAHSLLLAYSRFMDVELWFMPTPDNPELTRISALAALCRSITAFFPSVVNDERTGFKARLIERLSSSDVVHVFRFQEFVRNIDHPCIVWDIDELPWHARPADQGADAPPIAGDTLERLEADFARCLGKCRVVIGCSPLERPAACAGFEVVPNVARRPSCAGTATAVRQPRLLFVGNLNFVPNTDALAFFVEQVLPLLEQLVADVELVVVGRAPVTERARAAVDRLRHSSRVRFEFDVPDCTPHYARAAVAIAPIRLGGGTRVKIIEAFAHRRAVVSTRKGCEGLEVEHGNELLIADSAKGFAQACAELLRNPSLRERMAASAHGFSEREHAQQVVDTRLASMLRGLLQHRHRAPSP